MRPIYILMGVSGVGKTTLGKAMASHLNLNFYDGDDFHTQDNILKMKNGKPLTDGDREEWLKNISDKIRECPNGAVFTCSALKEKYRRFIGENSKKIILWIFLYESFDVIHERMKTRRDHFFKPELLRSQFDILEPPKYGLQIQVNASPEETLKNLIRKVEMPQIGIIGLGVMGKNIALNMAEKGIQVSVYNREVEGQEEGIAENFYKKNQLYFDFHFFNDLIEFVKSLPPPRNLILMVKAGDAVDSVINELSPLLEKDDLIMDGGNSHFKDTERRISELKKKGIFCLGIGISGGEEGARKGPSIMPGGSMKAYERVKKLLDAIAAKDKNGVGCCTYIGSGGSGHFVKMVHNGIEYGEMQLIAEFYHFMRFYLQFAPHEIAKLFKEWNKELNSYLLEITIDILEKKENEELLLDLILDVAGQKGTGGWSTQSALELGVPLDTITAAVMARNISADKGRRNIAHKAYMDTQDKNLETTIIENLLPAFRTAQIINHAIGFDLLEIASAEYEWNLNLSEIARVWTNGCIIRSGLMESLVKIFNSSSDHLLINPEIIPEINENRQSLSLIVSEAIKLNCPIPVSSAAINYLNNFVSAQSSANIIQAQRDYFGAHTYERIDRLRGQFYHTKWK